MEVHGILGNGFQEVIYQRALAIEIERQGLLFAREFSNGIARIIYKMKSTTT